MNPISQTSAYYRTIPGVGALRLALGASQRVWPALAVRAASSLFLTPLPLKLFNRGTTWGKQWRRERWPFEGGDMSVYSTDGSGPVALLVHGWGGHAGHMRALADGLAAQGLRAVIVEMPGHGHSAGWQTTLPQFGRALDYVTARLVQQGATVRVLVAHSLGATASAYEAARGLPVERLVLVAPAASPPAYTRMFAQIFGLSEPTRAAMQKRLEARAGALMTQFEPQTSGRRIGVPTLVVHDRDDAVNAFGDGQAFVDAIDGARMLATQGLGHRALLKDMGVVAEVVAFAVPAAVTELERCLV